MVLFVVSFKRKKGRKDLLSIVIMATKYSSAPSVQTLDSAIH